MDQCSCRILREVEYRYTAGALTRDKPHLVRAAHEHRRQRDRARSLAGKVDLAGLTVKAGTWLVDPTNLTVNAAAAASIAASLGVSTNVVLETTASGSRPYSRSTARR